MRGRVARRAPFRMTRRPAGPLARRLLVRPRYVMFYVMLISDTTTMRRFPSQLQYKDHSEAINLPLTHFNVSQFPTI